MTDQTQPTPDADLSAPDDEVTDASTEDAETESDDEQ